MPSKRTGVVSANTSRSSSSTAWSRLLPLSRGFNRAAICAIASATAASTIVSGLAVFAELPTMRNSNLLPVNANGDVRLRSVLSRASCGSLPTPISITKCSGSSPFAGLNGSGKHSNWSLVTDRGENLLEPGRTPHQNLRVLAFMAVCLKAVHDHAVAIRWSVANANQDLRLGADEAPPAIISVFMGDHLSAMIDAIASGKGAVNAAQEMIKLGVARLPEIAKDTTDRNRTSPFAFTGNKFEFRAVGSSQSIAFPVTLLNAAVAEAIGELTASLRAELKKTKKVDDAVLKVVRDAFKDTAAVRFEGNNYSEEWVKEAAKRGLPNLRRTPQALKQMTTKLTRDLLVKTGVFSAEELESRYHVRLERYVKDMLIEVHMLKEIVDTQILPASYAYSGKLVEAAAQAKAAGVKVVPQVAAANALGAKIETLQESRDALVALLDQAEGMHDALEKQAELLTGKTADAMAEVRQACDALELSVADDAWPLPKYREMLFPV